LSFEGSAVSARRSKRPQSTSSSTKIFFLPRRGASWFPEGNDAVFIELLPAGREIIEPLKADCGFAQGGDELVIGRDGRAGDGAFAPRAPDLVSAWLSWLPVSLELPCSCFVLRVRK